MFLLNIFQGLCFPMVLYRAVTDFRWQVMALNFLFVNKGDDLEYGVFNFPDVSRPVVRGHVFHGFPGESIDLLPVRDLCASQEVFRKQHDILRVVTKGWDIDADLFHPVEEIFPEQV